MKISCQRHTALIEKALQLILFQSSWFQLYDRNPHTFTPNIFWARPEDYSKAAQRIYHTPGHASFMELPLVTTP
jgi:predicted acyl esterase